MSVHTKQRPFGCSQCGNSYAQRSSLRLHVLEKHNGAPAVLACPVDGCVFHCYTGSRLRAHVVSHFRKK